MTAPLNPDAVRARIDEFLEGAATCGRFDVTEGTDLLIDASKALAAALPEVTSVESIPAKMRMLMWEGGEFEVGEIPDGYVLVGFEMETDRAWSMADKVTINIERQEVNDA